MMRIYAAPLLVLASITALTATGLALRGDTDSVRRQVTLDVPQDDGITTPSKLEVIECSAGNARENTKFPIESSADFIPLTSDDSRGFYVAYSVRTLNGLAPNNNVGQFLFELDGGEVLLYGSGYGNYSVALYNAARDAANVDSVLRGCMGKTPGSTPIRFVSPHWHGDHINPEFIHALENLGWSFVEILYHEDDDYFIRSYYNWQPKDRAKFTLIPHGLCNEEILSYPSPIGKIWFVARKGHAPGAIDVVIDVLDNPSDRVVVLGSTPGGECPDPPEGTRRVMKAHGNIHFQHSPQVVPYGCGVNPADSLTLINGTPGVGQNVVIGMDNPPGDVAPGSIPYLWMSIAPDPRIPCGTTLHLPGMAQAGKVLISTNAADLPDRPVMGAAWTGPGQPTPFTIVIPNDQVLVGLSVYLQGEFIDLTGGLGSRMALTTGLELRIGS